MNSIRTTTNCIYFLFGNSSLLRCFGTRYLGLAIIFMEGFEDFGTYLVVRNRIQNLYCVKNQFLTIDRQCFESQIHHQTSESI